MLRSVLPGVAVAAVVAMAAAMAAALVSDRHGGPVSAVW